MRHVWRMRHRLASPVLGHAIRRSVCVCGRWGPVKNRLPHLHNFRIISFIMALEVLGALAGTIKLDSASLTASHCSNVSSNLCCPDAKRWRWASPRHTLRRNTASVMVYGQLGTKTIGHQDNWALGQLRTRTTGHRTTARQIVGHQNNWEPRQLGTRITGHRTTGHQENWLPGQLGTRTIGHRTTGHRTSRHQDN